MSFLDMIEERLTLAEGKVFIASADLVQSCQGKDDLAWIDNPKRLAEFLEHFDLQPCSGGQKRGYRITKDWFAEWRARYPRRSSMEHGPGQGTLFPPDAPVNASNPSPAADLDESGHVNLTAANVSIPLSEQGFDTLTDEMGGKEASIS